MEELQEIDQVIPYLNHPLALVGFGLLLVFGLYHSLIRAVVTPFGGQHTGERERPDVLHHAFAIAVLLITLGFGLEFYTRYQDYEIEKLQIKVSQSQAVQVRTAQDDRRFYGLTKSVDSPQVKIRKGSSMPNTVRPGDTVEITTDYSVMLPGNVRTTLVKESWTLKKDTKVLGAVPFQNNRRAGGWVSKGTIPIPGDAEPGTYVIDHEVLAGSSYDTAVSVFTVVR